MLDAGTAYAIGSVDNDIAGKQQAPLPAIVITTGAGTAGGVDAAAGYLQHRCREPDRAACTATTAATGATGTSSATRLPDTATTTASTATSSGGDRARWPGPPILSVCTEAECILGIVEVDRTTRSASAALTGIDTTAVATSLTGKASRESNGRAENGDRSHALPAGGACSAGSTRLARITGASKGPKLRIAGGNTAQGG